MTEMTWMCLGTVDCPCPDCVESFNTDPRCYVCGQPGAPIENDDVLCSYHARERAIFFAQRASK